MNREPSAAAEDVTLSAESILKDCDVVFVLPHLGHGGAQRVVSLVANQWAGQGLAVVLITTLNNKPDAHHLDPSVRRIRLSNRDCESADCRGAAFRSMRSATRRAVSNAMQIISRHAVRRRSYEAGPKSTESGFRKMKAFIENISDRAITYLWRAYRFALYKVWKFIEAGAKTVLISEFAREHFPFPSVRAAENSARADDESARQRLFIWFARRLVGHREQSMRTLFETSTPPRIISFLTKTNIITAFATWDLPTHLVISERNDPDLQQLEPVWEALRSYAYRRADVITSNSEGIMQKMQRFCDPMRLRLLPNPLLLADSLPPPVARLPHFVIVARLVHQKAIDVLLSAFAKISALVPEWRLVIMGDGPLRGELEELALRLGIADRVIFHGHVMRPIEYLREAEVFVLPSRFEGMPNSLLEAMASGLPAIVSDASPGPLELIIDGETGLVVPVEDSDGLAAAMLRLAQDADYRLMLGANAKSLVGRHEWIVVERTWRDVLGLPVKTNEQIHVEPVAHALNGGKQHNA